MTQPNILIFMSDDQGPWAMNCAGTPELVKPLEAGVHKRDRLRQESHRSRRAGQREVHQVLAIEGGFQVARALGPTLLIQRRIWSLSPEERDEVDHLHETGYHRFRACPREVK